MSISIRTAVQDDCFAIAEIIKDSMGYDNSPAIIKKNLEKLSNKDSDIILIAEYNNQPVGFIHAEDYNSLYSEVLKDIISLAVKEKYQHLKIGTALMNAVEKWAIETGRCGVKVLSHDIRAGAHRFYKHLGYCYEKTQLNFVKEF